MSRNARVDEGVFACVRQRRRDDDAVRVHLSSELEPRHRAFPNVFAVSRACCSASSACDARTNANSASDPGTSSIAESDARTAHSSASSNSPSTDAGAARPNTSSTTDADAAHPSAGSSAVTDADAAHPSACSSTAADADATYSSASSDADAALVPVSAVQSECPAPDTKWCEQTGRSSSRSSTGDVPCRGDRTRASRRCGTSR